MEPQTIQYRKATPLDAPQIAHFQLAMALETENLELDPLVVAKGVRYLFDNPERGTYYVAEEGGQLVASLLILPEWSDWRNGDVLWIHSVYVAPGYRKQGVFKAMYDFLKNMVMSHPNLRGLRLYVEKSNAVAQSVYQRMGMTKEHYDLYEWLRDA